MKKLLTIAIGVLVCSALTMAQETVGGPKAEYPVLKNKLAKSEKNLSNEKKNISPKFWLSRAEVMMDIYNVHGQYVRVGANKTEIQLFFGEPGEKQTITKDGQQLEKYIYERITITYNGAGQVVEFEEINKIHENPLPEAFNALKKAQELDTDGKSGKKIAETYVTLKGYLENDAIQCFSKNDFECSLINFERIIEINQSPLMEGKIDTVIFYNAGMAASRANKPEKAIEYYEKARELNHNEPGLYVFLKNKYFEIGDTAKGIEILNEGFKKHAGAKDILVELINYYLLNDKAEQALEFLKIAQNEEPENKFYLFAEGTLWDKKEDYEKSIEAYNRCIEVDPDFFNCQYNKGITFYNIAVKEVEACNEIPANKVKEYDACVAATNETIQKSLPFIERANEIAKMKMDEDKSQENLTNYKESLDVLKKIYFRLRNVSEEFEAKYNKVNELSKTL